jgi:two-component system, OmpR family, alkaline phosphatase synthesis response regulator PhoP
MKNIKILIVEDDFDDLCLLKNSIKRLNLQIDTAQNGKEAISVAKKLIPDIILMDIMMPIMDGIEACKAIKSIDKLKNTIIIFFSEKKEEFLEISAFEAGGYDYISKPIKFHSLNKRIEVIIKREFNRNSSADNLLKVKDLLVDKAGYCVYKRNKKIIMPKIEFELFYFLCSNHDHLFSREELLKKVWGENLNTLARTVDVHITKIRKKIGDGYIETIKGVGYKLNY